MIHITPIKAFNDNYIWAIINQHSKQAIIIDPGQSEPVSDYLLHHQLQLTEIWITHKHHDHIGGVEALHKQFPHIKIVAHHAHDVPEDIRVGEGSSITAFNHQATVWHTKGHTENHLAYLLTIDDITHVFCGDTLFSGGCGRVFTGDMQAMHNSLQRFLTLDDNSLLYPAHEYTASNLKFGLHVEPDNQVMHQRLQQVIELNSNNMPSLPTSLHQEKQTNVFLRVGEQAVINSLAEKVAVESHQPDKIFTELRRLKDSF